MATIKEVSHLADVSAATVSRVLNGNVAVAAETRARVLAAVEKLDYHPNTFARGLVTNRSGGVGVVVNDIASPFFGTMLKGIERVIEAQGMHLMISSGHADAAAERDALDFLLRCRADVLIVHTEALSDAELVAFASRGTPLVLVGRYVAELASRSVYLDNEAGGRLMSEYLIAQGHTRIAHIAGPSALHDARARLAGYRQALENAGLDYDAGLVAEANFEEESGRRAAQQLLARRRDFSALFAANDQMAAGALSALREAGVDVPNEISLAGYDDVLLARYLYPSLSTVCQPMEAMGRVAAQLALAELRGESGEGVRRTFEPTLVIRNSVVPRS